MMAVLLAKEFSSQDEFYYKVVKNDMDEDAVAADDDEGEDDGK